MCICQKAREIDHVAVVMMINQKSVFVDHNSNSNSNSNYNYNYNSNYNYNYNYTRVADRW